MGRWMVVKGLAPGMQHRGTSDLIAEVTWIGGDVCQLRSCRLHQEKVDHSVVLTGDRVDFGRQVEDHMD